MGIPSKIINTPMPVLNVLKTKRSMQIAPAKRIYNIGITGYPKALYGRGVSGSFLRKTKSPPIVTI